ncbi:trypsin-like peptidase domain-containing protein [Desulfurococcaceae archaeon MEX13E-LK6-19]|nr:trypsin-like peptidase domain-containing protein [Desulfurococcaceae archaeon MEX13E-LK6-19]
MKLVDLSKMFSDIVKKASESVVMVSTIIPSITSLFVGREIRGIGSGFIIDKRLVVTNSHVVYGADRVAVLFSNGNKCGARIIAVDPYRDLALLETESDTPKPLKLGDSDKIKIGEIVFAIGSPLGLPGPTVTMGVVSAVGRTIVGKSITGEDIVLEDLIQTDAAINPGNSGGPLINASGEAIGITTAIVPFAQGIGFAIPINTVKRFLYFIKKYGRPIRAWIGVYVTKVTPELASVYGLPIDKGLLVVRVVPGSPAYNVGMKEGDIIVKVNGKKVEKVRELKEIIEDSIDKGYIVLEFIRGTVKYKIRVPISVEEL